MHYLHELEFTPVPREMLKPGGWSTRWEVSGAGVADPIAFQTVGHELDPDEAESRGWLGISARPMLPDG